MCAKNVNANVQKNSESKLSEINLSKFSNQLASVELKVKKEKQSIYIYPEGWTKEKINSDDGKKFRNNKRNTLKRFTNNIFVFAKTNNVEALKKEISEFKKFYKEFYSLNDFSVSSLTNSKDNERNVDLMLQIIKECETK